jgi:diguanylate cyclase (GGDEF)-like protein
MSKFKSNLDHNNRLILLVDDNSVHLRLLSKILESQGFKVKKTGNCKTAIETAKKQRPDLIVLDINMPKMNGYEVFRHLKSQEETVNIPIIFMGTPEQVTDKIRRFELNQIDCITKPFLESEVLSRVQNKLRISQQKQEITIYNQQLEKEKEEHKRFTKSLVTANQNLQSVVLLDAVTRVANRIKFDEYLNFQWQKLAREKSPLSLLLCNLDDNLTADDCLQQIATEIKSVVKRSTDLVARYENENFAVILPSTDSKGAVYVAKLIQEKVDSTKINHPQFRENKSFIFRIGVATVFPSVKMTPNSLIDMVEKAIDNAGDR